MNVLQMYCVFLLDPIKNAFQIDEICLKGYGSMPLQFRARANRSKKGWLRMADRQVAFTEIRNGGHQKLARQLPT